MARYVETSNLPNFEVVCSDGKKYVLLPFEHLSDIPSADVAPKREVAREIVEDIEMYVLGIKSGKDIIEKTTPKFYRLKRKDYMEAVLEYLANLKKKYTEEKE